MGKNKHVNGNLSVEHVFLMDFSNSLLPLLPNHLRQCLIRMYMWPLTVWNVGPVPEMTWNPWKILWKTSIFDTPWRSYGKPPFSHGFPMVFLWVSWRLKPDPVKLAVPRHLHLHGQLHCGCLLQRALQRHRGLRAGGSGGGQRPQARRKRPGRGRSGWTKDGHGENH